MRQYTRSAIGLLTAQYRSVLQKCFLVNIGLFALLPIAANAADIDITSVAQLENADNYKNDNVLILKNNITIPERGAGESPVFKGVAQTSGLRFTLKSDGTKTADSDTRKIIDGNGNSGYRLKGTEMEFSNIILTNFSAENKDDTWASGVIQAYSAVGLTIKIKNVDILNVTSEKDKDQPQPIWGGMLSIGEKTNATIENSTFAGLDVVLKNPYTGGLWPADGVSGGAVYVSKSDSTISSIINSIFSNNHMASTENYNAYGAGIANEGTITTISGSTFHNNTLKGTGENFRGENGPDTNNAYGGAIANGGHQDGGDITTIENSTFTENKVASAYHEARGGAIYNRGVIDGKAESTIGSITGTTFSDNVAEVLPNPRPEDFPSRTGAGYGGAIYNAGRIGNITNSTFTNNSAANKGGAIYNVSANDEAHKITITNTKFTGNTAGKQGGAIYNAGNIELVADGAEGKVEFKNNNKDTNHEAIYSAADSKLDIIAKMGGVFSLYDNINGDKGYTLNLSATDENSIIGIYGNVNNANATLSQGEMKMLSEGSLGSFEGSNLTVNENAILHLKDNAKVDYKLGQLTSDASALYKIDNIDFGATNKTDTITVAAGSTGTVTIEVENLEALANSMADETDETVQILNAESDDIQLALSGNPQTTANITASANMNNTQDVAAGFTLAETNTANDSIEFHGAKSALKAWAEYETDEDKTFTFENDGNNEFDKTINGLAGTNLTLQKAEDEPENVNVTLGENNNLLGNVNAGQNVNIKNLAVTNQAEATNAGTFELDSSTYNGDVTNAGTFELTSSTYEGNMTNTGTVAVTGAGESVNAGTITGAGNIIVGGDNAQTILKNIGKIDGTTTITNNATLNSALSDTNGAKLGNIVNEGTFNTTGGTLTQQITGEGTTNVTGAVVMGEDGSFSENGELNITEGASLDLSNDNELKGYNVGKLTSDANARYKFGLQAGETLAQDKNDYIEVKAGSTGTVYLDDIAFLGNLAEAAKDEERHEFQLIHVTKGEQAPELSYDNKQILTEASADMNDKQTMFKQFGLVSKDTTNDSIAFVGWRDTLAAWAEYETDEDKTFTFETGNYNVGDENNSGALTRDITELKGNNLTLVGKDEGAGYTLNLNEKNLLEKINEDQTVNIKNINIANSEQTENAGTLNLTDTSFSGDITNHRTLNTRGTVKILNNLINNDQVNTEGDFEVSGNITNNNIMNIADKATLNDVNGNGTLNLNGSKTVAEGTLSGNTINVNNSTLSFGEKGNLASNTDVNLTSGELAIDNKKVTAGNVVFDKDSTLSLSVNNLQDYGSLNAQSIDVAKDAKLKVTLAQGALGIKRRGEVTLLSSENPFVNNFTDEVSNNMYHFNKKEGDEGVYNITQLKTAQEVAVENGANSNIGGAADAWIEGDTFPEGSAQEIADELAGLAQNDAKGMNTALAALSPTSAPLVKTASVTHSNQLANSVKDHLNGIKSKGKGCVLAKNLKKDTTVWAKTYVGDGEFDGKNGIEDFDLDNKGVIIGADTKVSKNLKVGAGYAYDKSEATNSVRKDDIRTNSVFAYAEYAPNNWFVNGIASYNMAEYNETKRALNRTFEADYDVDYLSLQALTGYKFSGLYNITPEAGWRYNYIKRRSYWDSALQHVERHNMDVLTAVFGTRIETSIFMPWCLIGRPSLYLGVTYDLVSDGENSFVNLMNGSSYVVRGDQLSRFAVELGAGINAEITYKLEGYLGYYGQYRNNYTNHTGTIGLKYNF